MPVSINPSQQEMDTIQRRSLDPTRLRFSSDVNKFTRLFTDGYSEYIISGVMPNFSIIEENEEKYLITNIPAGIIVSDDVQIEIRHPVYLKTKLDDLDLNQEVILTLRYKYVEQVPHNVAFYNITQVKPKDECCNKFNKDVDKVVIAIFNIINTDLLNEFNTHHNVYDMYSLYDESTFGKFYPDDKKNLSFKESFEIEYTVENASGTHIVKENIFLTKRKPEQLVGIPANIFNIAEDVKHEDIVGYNLKPVETIVDGNKILINISKFDHNNFVAHSTSTNPENIELSHSSQYLFGIYDAHRKMIWRQGNYTFTDYDKKLVQGASYYTAEIPGTFVDAPADLGLEEFPYHQFNRSVFIGIAITDRTMSINFHHNRDAVSVNGFQAVNTHYDYDLFLRNSARTMDYILGSRPSSDLYAKTFHHDRIFTGNVDIQGNLNVIGNSKVTTLFNTEVQDNIIILNKGEDSEGIHPNVKYSGIEIDRGTLNPYRFVYDEDTALPGFRIGEYYYNTNLSPNTYTDYSNESIFKVFDINKASLLTKNKPNLGTVYDVYDYLSVVFIEDNKIKVKTDKENIKYFSGKKYLYNVLSIEKENDYLYFTLDTVDNIEINDTLIAHSNNFQLEFFDLVNDFQLVATRSDKMSNEEHHQSITYWDNNQKSLEASKHIKIIEGDDTKPILKIGNLDIQKDNNNVTLSNDILIATIKENMLEVNNFLSFTSTDRVPNVSDSPVIYYDNTSLNLTNKSGNILAEFYQDRIRFNVDVFFEGNITQEDIRIVDTKISDKIVTYNHYESGNGPQFNGITDASGFEVMLDQEGSNYHRFLVKSNDNSIYNLFSGTSKDIENDKLYLVPTTATNFNDVPSINQGATLTWDKLLSKYVNKNYSELFQGTTYQINIKGNDDGTVILSTPQDIDQEAVMELKGFHINNQDGALSNNKSISFYDTEVYTHNGEGENRTRSSIDSVPVAEIDNKGTFHTKSGIDFYNQNNHKKFSMQYNNESDCIDIDYFL